MTRAALKYFELKLGDTIGFDQFVEACRAVAAASDWISHNDPSPG
jgi:hypothetical protein